MAVWGMIQWSQGINKLLEARSLERELGVAAAETIQRGTQLERTEPAALPDTPITSKLADPSSVTDHTTELLNK